MIDLTVIIRSVGERTEQLCQKLILEQGIPEDQVVLIRNISPSSAATLKSFEIGIERNLKWTLRVDADVLLRKGSIEHIVDVYENLPENVFALQGYVLDKFFGGPRKAGFYIYRTSLLPLAVSQIPTNNVIRPDAETLNAMDQAGHPHAEVPYLVGLHDFEQYYRDSFRKCFVQAHKHLYRSELLLTIFREGMKKDPDFKVALDGFVAGLYYSDEVKINVNQEIYQQSFSELRVEEKKALAINDWNLEKVETIISNWNEPQLFKTYMNFTLSDLQVEYTRQTAQKKGLAGKLKHHLKIIEEKLNQHIKETGLLATMFYLIGQILLKISNIFIALSTKTTQKN
jgi:hypothetical protein